MKTNKSEKCPNTIGTINLSPQFNRPQQGLLYALHTTKRESKQQAKAKQHSKPEQQKPDFFKPHFNVADHLYVMLCMSLGEVPSISAVARSLSRRPTTMRHKTRWNIKNCNGCWAKNTLKSEMDVNHKKRNEEKHSEPSRNSSVFSLRPID